MDPFDYFYDFLRIAYKRNGDFGLLESIVDKTKTTGDNKIDLLNRLLVIFEDIPMVVFLEDQVRLKVITDLRDSIKEYTLSYEIGMLGETNKSEKQTLDDILDLFEMDDFDIDDFELP